MKAIILAAGRGSRMKSLTDQLPKCLIQLLGRTLFDRQLEALRDGGISEIGVVTGYKHEFFARFELPEFHNSRWAESNMVSSLACASEWLKDQPCLVSYSDIFFDSSAVRALAECEAELAITFDPNWRQIWEQRFDDPLVDAETFRLDSDGFVSEIGEQPESIDEVEGQYMGLLRFTPAGWSEFERIRSLMTGDEADRVHMTGMLQRVIKQQRVRVAGLPYYGVWGEVDSERDLEVALDLL